MAIINPDGLFSGERLARCSDEAQLHWPRLFVASNTFARLELDYDKIVTLAYRNFRDKPTEEQLSSWFSEYHRNYLMFVYEAPDGSSWGQWMTDKAYLSKYQTAADRKSPAPDETDLEQFRRDYVATKKRKSIKINNVFKPHLTTPIRAKPQL
jgi:RNA recognition motif-containing protein